MSTTKTKGKSRIILFFTDPLKICFSLFNIFFIISGKYFVTWTEKYVSVKRILPQSLKHLYLPHIANAVIYMVVEFEDGTVEVVPENWGYRPQTKEEQPSILIPPILEEVRRKVYYSLLIAFVFFVHPLLPPPRPPCLLIMAVLISWLKKNVYLADLINNIFIQLFSLFIICWLIFFQLILIAER